MSDQETARLLIRNEAAELIVRAKAAGLSVLVFNGPDGVIVDVMPLKPEPRIRAFVTTTAPQDLLGPSAAEKTSPSLPIGNLFFCSGDRDALKPNVGNRRFVALNLGASSEKRPPMAISDFVRHAAFSRKEPK